MPTTLDQMLMDLRRRRQQQLDSILQQGNVSRSQSPGMGSIGGGGGGGMGRQLLGGAVQQFGPSIIHGIGNLFGGGNSVSGQLTGMGIDTSQAPLLTGPAGGPTSAGIDMGGSILGGSSLGPAAGAPAIVPAAGAAPAAAGGAAAAGGGPMALIGGAGLGAGALGAAGTAAAPVAAAGAGAAGAGGLASLGPLALLFA